MYVKKNERKKKEIKKIGEIMKFYWKPEILFLNS